MIVLWAAAALIGAPAGAHPQQAEPRDSGYGCIGCHSDKRRAFVQGVHAERGIRCEDCHGGDPSEFEVPAAHRGGGEGGRRFSGAPDKARTVALCGSCHSDPDRMRQYGLPTDQVAAYRTSRHGLLLLRRGDRSAPSCTDCHDAHLILRPDDARSSVYPTNVPATCGRCHGDRALAARYGLPGDEVERYRRSAHGVAVLERQNFAAPTCLGCHGSHSALPPTVTEIASVCGRCHVLVGQAFDRGPHGQAARSGRLAGCLGCHSNHGTERVAPERISATCTGCHASGTPADTLGAAIQRDAERARADLEAAAGAIEELTRAGRPTADARFRYQTALTAYRQIGGAQHGLDRDRLEELTRRVRSISRDLRAAAAASAERRWEHGLLLVPLWFLVLSAVALAGLTLQRLERRPGEGEGP